VDLPVDEGSELEPISGDIVCTTLKLRHCIMPCYGARAIWMAESSGRKLMDAMEGAEYEKRMHAWVHGVCPWPGHCDRIERQGRRARTAAAAGKLIATAARQHAPARLTACPV
jgi:hypothetical protein